MPFALPLAGLGCRERLPNGLGRASPPGPLFPANRFRFFIDVTIRRPRERRLGAPLGGPAITFPTPPAIRTVHIGSFPIRSPIGIMENINLGTVTSERISDPASDRLDLGSLCRDHGIHDYRDLA